MSKNIHFIAMGGSVMHNLALALHDYGYTISGSDDEIYDPSRSRLEKAGILPEQFGWFPEKITDELDAVILGMHARLDNPELQKAQALGLPIYSFPEYVGQHLSDKTVVVVAGSHGKTTTTSMIMHVLGKQGLDYDYLVGAQLDGFDRMVRLSDAPIIVLEGDEYLSSPLDRRPKMMHYNPDIAIITGVAWDHINVFPTLENYVSQFDQFIYGMRSDTTLFYYENDSILRGLLTKNVHQCSAKGYNQIDYKDGNAIVGNEQYEINLIGNHNLQNLEAARLVCEKLGISSADFFKSIGDFTGAAKRLQFLGHRKGYRVYLDFAHAPSKVKATCDAVKDWFPEDKLYSVLELHTFSSLNKDFLPNYAHSLAKADQAYVVYDKHTLEMKRMPELDVAFVREQFRHDNLTVFDSHEALHQTLAELPTDGNVLLMSSGNFGKFNIDTWMKQ